VLRGPGRLKSNSRCVFSFPRSRQSFISLTNIGFITLTYTYVYSHKISSLRLPLAASPSLPTAVGTTASYCLHHPTYLLIVVFSQRPFLDNTSGGNNPTDPAWPSQVIPAISLLTTTAYLRCVDPLHGRPGGTFLTSKHYLIYHSPTDLAHYNCKPCSL
jgi:hypothetical protein